MGLKCTDGCRTPNLSGTRLQKACKSGKRWHLLLLSSLPWLAHAQAANDLEREVAHLLQYLERSECQFYRNGSWHTAPEARSHLDQKYRYFLQKGLITRTEHFIDRAATASSYSGKSYYVKCKGTEAVPSADWLQAELARYRRGLGVPKP